jgi:hypothetical protein
MLYSTKFMTVLSECYHGILWWTNYPFLSSYLLLDLPSCLFYLSFPIQNFAINLYFPRCWACLFFLDVIILPTLGEDNLLFVELLTIWSSKLPLCSIRLAIKNCYFWVVYSAPCYVSLTDRQYFVIRITLLIKDRINLRPGTIQL